MDWRWLSTTVELVGTLVTGFGLFYAYGRAVRLPGQVRELWNRIRHGPRVITGGVAVTLGSPGMLATGDVHTPFTMDENWPDDLKFAAIQAYVRELRIMFGPLNAAVERLDNAIEQAKEHADTVAAQALTDAEVELKRFDAELKQLQSVDLRWAAIGAFIMAVGYVLSYFACFRF
jgi:hypothetical protein